MVPVKVAVLTFVIFVLGASFDALSFIWQPLVVLSAVASLIWGCFAAFFELKTKRFLAYASINQMGFLLIGIASGTIEGYRATLIYLFFYVAINLIFLIVFLNTRRSDGLSLIYLTDFRRLAETNWSATFFVALALFSIAGIPPLAGFFGKYYLLLYAQEQGLYGLVIVALATSLISTYYYLRLIKIFWFENGVGVRKVTCRISIGQFLNISLLSAGLLTFIYFSKNLLEFFDLITICMLGARFDA
jgi:NADH-quinone oxidoreductase subunit N